MLLWIALGLAAWLGLLLVFAGMAAAARRGDREDRAIVAAWLSERASRPAAGGVIAHRTPTTALPRRDHPPAA